MGVGHHSALVELGSLSPSLVLMFLEGEGCQNLHIQSVSQFPF